MKKLIVWLLVLTMCLSTFAGCGQEAATPTTTPSTEAPTQETEAPATEDLSDPDGLAAALEYLKTIYKNAGGLSPKDYTRIGTVPVGTKKFEVVWTASVSEDLVKPVRGEDGMVTIDVNEECDTETPYTLTATISDAAGNSVSHSWEHTLPASLSAEEILTQAYALADGQSLPYDSTLTGIVTSVDTLWSEQYGNITVTMVVEGLENMPVQCYRLSGGDAKNICVGDTITVTGVLTNYKGKIEFAQGCILDNRISGGGTAPGEKEYTYFWHLNDGDRVVIYNRSSKMALSNQKTGYYNKGVKITKDATGKVSGYGPNEVWTVKFNGYSYSFIDANGNEMALDKKYSNLNEKSSYNEWKLVRVSSTKYMIENVDRKGYFLEWYDKYDNFSTYNPVNPETDKQFLFSFYRLPEDEVIEDTNAYFDATPVENPTTGKAYKLVLFQNGLGKELGFTGKMQGYYYGTSENLNEVVDVYLESANGGYMLYFMNEGVKTYLNVVPRADKPGSVNVVLETTAKSVFALNTEFKYLSTVVDGKTFYLGTYGTNSTISASNVSYIEDTSKIGVSQFVAYLADTVRVSGPTVDPEEPGEEGEMTLEEQLAAADKLANGEYLDQTTSIVGNIAEINDAYSEQYGNITFTVDVEGIAIKCYRVKGEGMDKLQVGDVVRVEGKLTAYNGKAQFDKTATVKVLSLADQLAEANALANNTYLTYKTYIEGKVSEINDAYSAQYGNITFTVDVDGTAIKCYRVKGEGMDKLAVGDTVKVSGKLTAYNNKAQFDKTAVVTVVPAEGGEEPDVPGEGGEATAKEYVIAVKNGDKYYAMSTATSGRPAAVEIQVENGVVTSANAPVFAVTEVEGGVTISHNGKYLGYNTSGTEFATKDTAYVWYASNGSTADTVKLTANTVSSRVIAYQISGIRFGAYSTSNTSGYIVDLYLLPANGEGGAVEPDVPGEGGGEEPDVPGEGGNEGSTDGIIDTVEELTAGTYKMGGYLETYTNNGTTYDWTANPYHLFTGSIGSGDLYTTPYSYADGTLTIKAGETYEAKNIELIAVEGKDNTYYIKCDGKYLYSTSYANRKLAAGDTPVEWVASNNANGGITMTTTMAEGTISLGTAGAQSKMLRSYKTESTLKYGLVFFGA